jgi:acyl-CoA synthetase (NDP forming)
VDQARLEAMERIFRPRSLAFVGASNNIGKWGGIIFHNLLEGGWEGKIYPVNPKEATVQGVTAYPSIAAIPGEVDLAVFTIPAAAMPAAIDECVAKRVPAGVVISAGFGELGDEGKAAQTEMVRRARAGGMVLVGPNGQGISSPHVKLHPWMPAFKPDPGAIAIASQSGNVSTFIVEQLAEFKFGCSKVVSAGNCADLDFPDYLDYFRSDPDTRVILLYIEGINDGRAFFAAARRAALAKPVVLLKAGRTAAGTAAAATHTGVLAGADAVFTAACRQAGVTRVYTLEEAAIMAATFVATPVAAGGRTGVITGGGGIGVIAADACVGMGLDLPRLSEPTIAQLKQHLPPWWAPNNPVDMVAGIGFGGPRELIPILMESGEFDGVLLLSIGWFYSMADAVNDPHDLDTLPDGPVRRHIERDAVYLQIMADYARRWNKPLLMHSNVARLAVRRNYPGLINLLDQGIMIYPTIEDTVRAMAVLAERGKFLAVCG